MKTLSSGVEPVSTASYFTGLKSKSFVISAISPAENTAFFYVAPNLPPFRIVKTVGLFLATIHCFKLFYIPLLCRDFENLIFPRYNLGVPSWLVCILQRAPISLFELFWSFVSA